jgi:hypothetical protein
MLVCKHFGLSDDPKCGGSSEKKRFLQVLAGSLSGRMEVGMKKLLVLLLLLFYAGLAQATNFYVRPGGSGGNGSSWNNA